MASIVILKMRARLPAWLLASHVACTVIARSFAVALLPPIASALELPVHMAIFMSFGISNFPYSLVCSVASNLFSPFIFSSLFG